MYWFAVRVEGGHRAADSPTGPISSQAPWSKALWALLENSRAPVASSRGADKSHTAWLKARR